MSETAIVKACIRIARECGVKLTIKNQPEAKALVAITEAA